MKCLVIVDAQNDFLPGGSFNSKGEYMNALNKINSIRLKLYNCREADLVKRRDCEDTMEHHRNKLLNDNIVEYYKCSSDIDEDDCGDDILIFPFDKNGNAIKGRAILDGKTLAGTAIGGAHTVNGGEYMTNGRSNPFRRCHPKEDANHRSTEDNTMNSGECASADRYVEEGCPKRNGVSDFAMHILSVDYHPQMHVSFAETHRTIYREICRNSESCNNDSITNGHEHSVSSTQHMNKLGEYDMVHMHIGRENMKNAHRPEEEQGVAKESTKDNDSILFERNICNLTDVLKNIKKIKSPKCIYRNVNSVKDIIEYSKLYFLNETIDVWPIHCVRNTPGCKIHRKLIRHIDDVVIKKADSENRDSHTIFENEQINQMILKRLKEKNISSVYICGFIFEYCVKETALSFHKFGFDTYIVEDATAYLLETDHEKTFLKKKGIKFVQSSSIF
ncbi:nicotinamidase, putative [Plasmodium ovale]|uniref:nicotinamidase n=2 Tax=Plasmodium ovale TaxID=36330 RepID=A0A1A8VQZ1_PLAOA|nr:nicotinamidase, putative [Plasmodium ovale curtisi]SBT01263.1 nicotinamidase, putative [Plasmodium ovale curtisi]SCP04186.1 nicotinamidase, putative [Plasmodium ovale]